MPKHARGKSRRSARTTLLAALIGAAATIATVLAVAGSRPALATAAPECQGAGSATGSSTSGSPGGSSDCPTPRQRRLHGDGAVTPDAGSRVGGTDNADADTDATQPLGGHGSWRLAFADEFSGDSLDTRKWIPCVSAGWTREQSPQPCSAVSGSSESYHPQNNVVSGGVLHQMAQPDGNGTYRSGAVSTADNAFGFDQPAYRPFSYTYGFLEVRMRAPTAQGMWPAVWQMPVGGGGHDEMDLMEHIQGYQYMTLHGPQSQGNPVWGQAQLNLDDLSSRYHVFGADWEPGRLTWYVDGKQVGTTTNGVPSVPEFVQANLQIGGMVGQPPSDLRWPVSQDIDYVRVFRHPSS